MRVLQLVHGFPPRENAGTEQYAARLADGLRRRGHEVHTLASTRAPGHPMYTRLEEPGLTRVVNNAPFAGHRRGGADPAVDDVVAEILARFRPDLVHLQHPAYLSTTWRTDRPVVWTLHDAWGWCPALGTLFRQDLGAACGGPNEACPACASSQVREAGGVALGLAAAGRLRRWIPPDRLHRAWRRLPGALRARVTRGAPTALSADDVAAWRTAHAALARRATLVSPSRWLAAAAEAEGWGPVRVLPFGADPVHERSPRRELVFLGTLAPHKGPDLVLAAWERAGRPAPLRLHGPPGPDLAWAAKLPSAGPVAATDVPALLGGARALVLGSRWPENSPLVILEARAAGCPVLAPAIGGIPELVEDGVDGWLYPPGDVEALAALLRRDPGVLTPRPPPPFGAHAGAVEALYQTLV